MKVHVNNSILFFSGCFFRFDSINQTTHYQFLLSAFFASNLFIFFNIECQQVGDWLCDTQFRHDQFFLPLKENIFGWLKCSYIFWIDASIFVWIVFQQIPYSFACLLNYCLWIETKKSSFSAHLIACDKLAMRWLVLRVVQTHRAG